MTPILTDRENADALTLMEAEQKKARISGPTAFCQRMEWLDRLHRDTDGLIKIEVHHPTATSRSTGVGGNESWIGYRVRLFPLADGVQLLLSDNSPELELARRRHVLFEEHRARELRSAEAQREAVAQKANLAREQLRRSAWCSLSSAERASVRAGEVTDVKRFAQLLVEESSPTAPPDGWAPSTQRDGSLAGLAATT